MEIDLERRWKKVGLKDFGWMKELDREKGIGKRGDVMRLEWGEKVRRNKLCI